MTMAIQRGEIYFVNLSPAQGREQAGHRPALVISSDAVNRLPLVVSVVVGTKGENISRDLSDQRSRRCCRQRVADGNGLYVFSGSCA
jgi:mRNA-degrading endonuclease toxin of MazEF toxin-antitoxin module